MYTPPQHDKEIFPILLYRNDAAELLAESAPLGFRLPALQVPTRTRIAEQLTAAARRAWNLETFCLFAVSSGVSPQASLHYQVVEARDRDSESPVGMRWLPVTSLCAAAFENAADFTAIENSLATLDQYRRGELPGAFGKPGSLRTVTEWVAGQSAAAGLRLSGKVQQFNASPTFSLIRFETDGPALWFKAVGPPNLREFPIAASLSQLFPHYVPAILAAHVGWNAWLMTEVPGLHPEANSPSEVWVAVARQLAELQAASFGRTLRLLEDGCHDTRVRSLVEMIDPFLEIMAGLMETQTKPSPAPLSRSELAVLGTQLREIFSTLSRSSLPNSLSHLDLHPGNILVSDGNCVFLDWAEACVGHPFVAFEYLLEHIRKLRPLDNSFEANLTSSYTLAWRPFVDPQTIAQALAVAPLLAIFTCAVAGGTWQDAGRRSRPEIAALLRSLTRGMKREADELEQWGAACAP
jgi:Phosphotransferase enzyme family